MTTGPIHVEPASTVPHSPLALFIKDSHTSQLLNKLSAHLEALRHGTANGDPQPVLELRRHEVDYCRDMWEEGVLAGEHKLYDLATLFAWRLTGSHRIQHVARVLVGVKEEVEGPEQTGRIMIEEGITRENLKRVTDYTLAARIARHFQYRPRHDAAFGRLYARASFLELRPLTMEEDAPATRVLTRVKAADQISNKVCDALFSIDELVKRDKILNVKSKYVKDVFGIKILTPRRADSYRVDEILRAVHFTETELQELGVEFQGTSTLDLLEHKDYLALPPEKKKRTGWEAIKNVYQWGGQVFEVQIQTEANYFLEMLDLTDISHRTFEMQRRNMRHELEARLPHYADFRRVLKYVLGTDETSADLPSWLRIVD